MLGGNLMQEPFMSWEERPIEDEAGFAERRELLASRGLSEPGSESLILGFYEDDRLVATGSLVGSSLQGIAVARDREGEGGANIVVTALIKAATGLGLRHLFVFTKSEEAPRFVEMGFSPVAAAREAALLEWGIEGVQAWKEKLRRIAAGRPRGSGVAVVNCNPFTLGHRKLLEFASASVPWLYVLVVEEEKSLFPFAARLELVRRGARDLPNVEVLAGGPYVISSATFPTYFTRPDPAGGDAGIAALHASLDLEVFRTHIAPALGTAVRFVGSEPYCPTTSVYNRLMKEILGEPRPGSPRIEVREMPRFEIGGEAVSASRVRDLIRRGELEGVRALVPESTWDWLASPEAAPVLEKIRKSDSRH